MAVPLLLFAFLILYIVYRYVVHPLVVSPLSRVPNAHPTAPFSSAWILWSRYVGKENVTVYNAHKRLGPMIRLGPNEISLNCVDGGIRTVSLTQHFLPSHQSFKPQCTRYEYSEQRLWIVPEVTKHLIARPHLNYFYFAYQVPTLETCGWLME